MCTMNPRYVHDEPEICATPPISLHDAMCDTGYVRAARVHAVRLFYVHSERHSSSRV